MLSDHISKFSLICVLLFIFLCQLGNPVFSESTLPEGVKGVDIVEHLGQKLSLDLPLVDQHGKTFLLKEILSSKRPVVLSFAYYGCPMLCSLVTDGLNTVINDSKLVTGKDFDVLTISIDPTDTPATAMDFSKSYEDKKWTFATGQESVVSHVAKLAGFGYRYDTKSEEYAHAAGIIILTADGTISRYLYGAMYKPLDFKLSIAEAKQGKMVSTVEHVLLFCYNYDSNSKGYVLVAQRIMKAGALITILLLGGALLFLHHKKSHDKFIK